MIFLIMGIKFRSILDSPAGVRYFLEKLELSSSFSRVVMFDTEMALSEQDIAFRYSELAQFSGLLASENIFTAEKLRVKLNNLKDVRNSLVRMSRGTTPDDIEFFEIKALAMLNEDIRQILANTEVDCIRLPDLCEVVSILDPDKNRITSFYIYDSYSKQLRGLRKSLREYGSKTESEAKDLSEEGGTDHESAKRTSEIKEAKSKIILEIFSLEDKIREDLASKITPYIQKLAESLMLLAKADILLAKAFQTESLGLIIPSISNKEVSYRELFNPEVLEILKTEGKEFQKIDIDFDSPLLITGANMGGKSLTLKTLALTQYLFQFGFGIPAKEASIIPVDEIFLSIGDEQNFRQGLSSFAAEMKRIDKSIVALRKKKEEKREVLILVDEPAATTNPLEGIALATALLTIFVKQEALSVITTHYNIANVNCKRLRVRGIKDGIMNYALIPDSGGDIPKEALGIALSLGVDREWLDIAKEVMIVKRKSRRTNNCNS